MTALTDKSEWPPHVVLYTREGCHLCEEALAILASHGLNPTIRDIDTDPELHRRFTDCVPVVEIDGRERFRGRISPVLLRRQLWHRAMETHNPAKPQAAGSYGRPGTEFAGDS
jgi:glutaredoxin